MCVWGGGGRDGGGVSPSLQTSGDPILYLLSSGDLLGVVVLGEPMGISQRDLRNLL